MEQRSESSPLLGRVFDSANSCIQWKNRVPTTIRKNLLISLTATMFRIMPLWELRILLLTHLVKILKKLSLKIAMQSLSNENFQTNHFLVLYLTLKLNHSPVMAQSSVNNHGLSFVLDNRLNNTVVSQKFRFFVCP